MAVATNDPLRGYKPPKGYQTVRLTDFSGGLNTEVPADLLEDTESPVSVFVDRSIKGIAKPANGRAARFGSPFGSGGISGIGSFAKSDGTSYLMMGQGSSLYRDKPHLSFQWATQADFQAGTADPMVSEPGGGGLTLADATWQQIKNSYATWNDVKNAT